MRFVPVLVLSFAAVMPLHSQTPSKPRPATRAKSSAHSTFAAHPYMGWSSWSLIRAKPTEENIKAQADALIANNLPASGYRYINIDDGWSNGFDDQGIPRANPASFPDGMEGMAKYMHTHGLKFGIYINPGITAALLKLNPQIEGTTAHIADITDQTQAGSTRRNSFRIDFAKPAAAAYIRSQVAQFDRWGVDFIKFDFVGPGGGNVPADNREELRQWHAAVARASHPIWLELSNWLSFDQAALWRATANGWRIENDIECYGPCDNSSDPAIHGNLTVWSKVAMRFVDVVRWATFAGPGSAAGGGWNDLDTLELGNGERDGLTPVERQTMFTLWTISCAPLYLGSDLTKMDSGDLALITNRELIAVDQAGVPARPLDIQHLRNKPQQAWLTTYPDGSAILTVFNLDAVPGTIKLAWHEIDALRDTHFAEGPAPTLHDLVSASDVPSQMDGVSFDLLAHGSRVFRISAKK
jgi:alpha-galactosidase